MGEVSEKFDVRRPTLGDEKSRSLDLGPRTSNLVPQTWSLLFTLAALVCLFVASLQMDRAVLEFVRTIHATWWEQIGDAGYIVGSGAALIAISGLFVAVGYARARPELRLAGLWGWGAHAIAALLVQSLKHGIGRPRPRLNREDEFFTGPTLESGFDSFPSGHATASFAVATVIAKYFPRFAWAAYTVAGYSSLTRIFRGSHFVSDVAAGIVLGVMVGTLAGVPMRQWGGVARHVLLAVTPWLVVGCAVIWLTVLPSPGTLTTGLLVAAGASAWIARVAQAQARGEGQVARGKNPSPSP